MNDSITKHNDTHNEALFLDKTAAKEYIRMAVGEKERFNRQHRSLLHFEWNPVRFINSKMSIRQKYNYWLPYIRTAEPFDEEVAYLFMVLQMLLLENESWRQSLKNDTSTIDDLHVKCKLTGDVQFELLMRAVEALKGPYFQEVFNNVSY